MSVLGTARPKIEVARHGTSVGRPSIRRVRLKPQPWRPRVLKTRKGSWSCVGVVWEKGRRWEGASKKSLTGPFADAPRRGDVTGRLHTASSYFSCWKHPVPPHSPQGPPRPLRSKSCLCRADLPQDLSMSLPALDWTQAAGPHLASAFTWVRGCDAVFQWAGSGRRSSQNDGWRFCQEQAGSSPLLYLFLGGFQTHITL